MRKEIRRIFIILSIFVTILFFVRLKSNKYDPGGSQIEEYSSGKKNQKCYYDVTCELPQMLFRIQSETDSEPPFACLNDISLFDVKNVATGINLVALNGTTGDVLSTGSFDVSASDEKLMKWLSNTPYSSIIIAASFGDVAEHVSPKARQFFGAFGASLIDSWRVGNAYAIIGQRGIGKGEAIETVSAFASPKNSIMERCMEIPLAETKIVNISENDFHRADVDRLEELGAFEEDALKNKMEVKGVEWKNCGMATECKPDEIAIHMFSGKNKDDRPRMCIGGRIYFDKDLNDAGRGLNLAILEPKTERVTAVAHFDSYEDESNKLEEWLDSIPPGCIVAVLSFDEASNMLSDMARNIFYELGSSMIHRLKFRASWYFIGQKGIGAYTPFEDLHIPSGNNWATPIETSFCLPKSLYRWSGRRDAVISDGRNLPKRHFCAKYDRHDEFCDEENLDVAIVPHVLRDEKRANNAIFNTPILIASGLGPDSLRTTLESLISQEGINTQMVLVTFDKEYSESADLSTLFHVKGLGILANTSYNDYLLRSIKTAFSIFPEAKSLIVIEEDVTLSSDWLRYLGDIYDNFMKDDNTNIAMAFNPNGFDDISGSPMVVYRVNGQSPFGSYIIKRKVYENHMKVREFCCIERGQWDLGNATALVPALSRVRIHVDELERKSELFNRDRISSMGSNVKLSEEYLDNRTYVEYLKKLVRENKQKTTFNDIFNFGCENWKQSVHNTIKSVVITYKDKNEAESLFKCLGFYHTSRILNMNEVFRFALNEITEVVICQETWIRSL